MTNAERFHVDRVAQLRCVLCVFLGLPQEGRTTVHHIKEGTGISQRSQNWLTIPLCNFHHQGPGGVHGLGTKGFYLRYKLDELDLLAMTIETLSK